MREHAAIVTTEVWRIWVEVGEEQTSASYQAVLVPGPLPLLVMAG